MIEHFTLSNKESLDLSQYFGKKVCIRSFVLVKAESKKKNNKEVDNHVTVSMSIGSNKFIVCTLIPNKIPQVKTNMIFTDTEGLTIHVNGTDSSKRVNVILEVH